MSERSRDNKPSRSTLVALAGGLSLSLLLTGCDSASASDRVQSADTAPQHQEPKIHITNFPDGTRMLDFEELNKAHSSDANTNNGLSGVGNLVQWCMNGVLYSSYQSRFIDGGAALTNGGTDPACADNRLTEADGFAGPAFVFDKPLER